MPKKIRPCCLDDKQYSRAHIFIWWQTLVSADFSLQVACESIAETYFIDTPAAKSQDIIAPFHVDYSSLDYFVLTLNGKIEDCLKKHKCSFGISGAQIPDQGHGMLPARCLELCGDRTFLRQIEGLRGSSITLSHRWTQDTEDTRTTMANYEARLGGTWDCTIPKVYSDTLDLAQKLGIKYVWVDSMCVIQAGDEGEDWGKEAVKMATYFQGSLMTVLASSATRQHGLNPERKHVPSSLELARLPYRNKAGQVQGHMYAYRIAISPDRQFEAAVLSSNLLSRGWVFQEYHLSRRSVVFTPYDMFFRCQDNVNIVDDRKEQPRIQREPVTWPLHDTHFWYQEYVPKYSGPHLTKTTDRLIALSGVMDESLKWLTAMQDERQSRRPDSYHWNPLPDGIDEKFRWQCGLWKSDITAGLVWQMVASTRVSRERLSQYPSWSWASILAPVSWEGLMSTGRAMLRDMSLKYEDGVVRNSSPVALHTKGSLLPVLVRAHFEVQREIVVVSELSNSQMATGANEDPPRSKNWRKICLAGDSKSVSGWASFEHPDFQDDVAFLCGPVIYALGISSQLSLAPPYAHGKFHGKSSVFTVLYVRSVVGGESYERIGVGKLFGDIASVCFRQSQERLLILV